MDRFAFSPRVYDLPALNPYEYLLCVFLIIVILTRVRWIVFFSICLVSLFA